MTGLPLLDWRAGAAANATGRRPSPVAHAGRYPNEPGAKAGGTSAEAADSVRIDARVLRAQVVEALEARGPMTADEIASAIGRSELSVRPRVSELRLQRRVRDTGERRTNASGRRATVWALEAKGD